MSSKTVILKVHIRDPNFMRIKLVIEYYDGDSMNRSLFLKLKMQIFNGLIAILQLIF